MKRPVSVSTQNKISEDLILDSEMVGKSKGAIIKVTTESYYQMYETEEQEVDRITEEWFGKFSGYSHAYRDGSKIPWTNIVKIEQIK